MQYNIEDIELLIRQHTSTSLSGAGCLPVSGQPRDVRFLGQEHMHMQGLEQILAYATPEVLAVAGRFPR